MLLSGPANLLLDHEVLPKFEPPLPNLKLSLTYVFLDAVLTNFGLELDLTDHLDLKYFSQLSYLLLPF